MHLAKSDVNQTYAGLRRGHRTHRLFGPPSILFLHKSCRHAQMLPSSNSPRTLQMQFPTDEELTQAGANNIVEFNSYVHSITHINIILHYKNNTSKSHVNIICSFAVVASTWRAFTSRSLSWSNGEKCPSSSAWACCWRSSPQCCPQRFVTRSLRTSDEEAK